MDKKAKMKIFSGFASMLVLLVLVIASTFVLFRPDSFAWLAHRDQVTGNGMGADVKTDINITYYQKRTADGEYAKIDSFDKIFEGLYPGDTVWIKVEYENADNVAHTANVSLVGFDGCEEPLVKNSKYYYLGTQLKVVETEEFLMTPPDNLVCYDAEQATIPALALGSVDIAVGATAELEFSICFVNYASVDQSEYRNFGSLGAGECCYRKIYSDFG